MTESQLREVNHIPARMLVRAGSTLVVPRDPSREADVSEHLADHAMIALQPDGPALRRVSFKAGKQGSTVSAIARQYKVSPTSVADWNNVGPQASFRPGQAVIVDPPSKGTRAARPAAARPSSPKATSGRRTR